MSSSTLVISSCSRVLARNAYIMSSATASPHELTLCRGRKVQVSRLSCSVEQMRWQLSRVNVNNLSIPACSYCAIWSCWIYSINSSVFEAEENTVVLVDIMYYSHHQEDTSQHLSSYRPVALTPQVKKVLDCCRCISSPRIPRSTTGFYRHAIPPSGK